MSKKQVSFEDVEDFFKAWSRSKNPRHSPIEGFIDWTWDYPEKTLEDLKTDGTEENLIEEIVSGMEREETEKVNDHGFIVRRRKYADVDEEDLREAAEEFLDGNRDDLIETLEDSLNE